MSLSHKEKINLVWLKRDLRTQDHLPLVEVLKSEIPFILIFCFEPSLIQHPDTSLRHLQFCFHSLKDIEEKLASFNIPIHLHYQEALEVFKNICNQFQVVDVFSYQESGIQKTYDRDIAVKKFLVSHKIGWKEYKRNGVVRGIKNRSKWDKHWVSEIKEAFVFNEYKYIKSIDYENAFVLPNDFKKKLNNYPKAFQKPGETEAFSILDSFLNRRGRNYYKHISKPELAQESCSRLSPYIAWGNVSLRQVYQLCLKHPSSQQYKRAYQGFRTRLMWNSHFIQKFEMECRYENECINKGYELMPQDNDAQKLKAWKEGLTGYPLIDACMRCLIETGWINFRMRAMLVSFLTHNLSCDWRLGAYHLANLFLDYEPGIHYPQIQMQAGTTGVNTIRMYNPTKQAMDNDKDGVFIKKWLPELANVPLNFIHKPWEMTLMDQMFCNTTIGTDYPKPIVDLKESAAVARDKIWGFRKNSLVKQEQVRIINTHVRDQKRKV